VYRTVVVGHDASPAADAALRLAELLADDDATLVLTRIASRSRRADAWSQLEQVRGGIGAQRLEARVTSAHSVERGLAALAREAGAELIVVGSDRRPGDYRAHRVLGLRLLRGAPCAVAIASADTEPELRHIGVAYNGSAEAELALAAGYGIAQRVGAAVTLYLSILPELVDDLHAQLAFRDAAALLDDAAERAPADLNPETVIVKGYASEALAARVAGVVDLLVVGSRRHGPLREALAGSTSRALAVELECAVLVPPRRSDVLPRPRAVAMDDRGALGGEVQ
jgi:nucleotide-binding universal stress UspA family protein